MNNLGFRRVAVASPELRIADVGFNIDRLTRTAHEAASQSVDLLVFPELAITGYSCGDLFFQPQLQQATLDGLKIFCKKTSDLSPAFLIGLPLSFRNRLYNTTAIIQNGHILGIVPKTFLPNRNEFYEARWFSSGASLRSEEISLHGSSIPFGVDLLFEEKNFPAFCLGIEICEDLWAVEPPSGKLALAGATVLANPSASPEQLGKSAYRNDLLRQQSARCLAAYLYAAAGANESTGDVVFSGHCLILENGRILGESTRFDLGSTLLIRDIDCDFLETQRWKNTPFSLEGSDKKNTTHRRIPLAATTAPIASKREDGTLFRPISKHPFVPESTLDREASCSEIFAIQSTGLARRLKHTNLKNVV
ncbi:MAG: nitrilase-related carbon-nitrogen hydrolase, partial [Chthoniobacterales bacterium]